MEFVRENPNNIEEYSDMLVEKFYDEVIEIYKKYIMLSANSSSNRKAYQGVCRIIKRYKKIAGKGPLVSGSAIMVSGIVGGPVWLGCLAAVGTAVAVRYSIDNPKKAFEKIKGTFETTSKVLKRASLSYN